MAMTATSNSQGTPRIAGIIAISAIAILFALNRGFKGVSVSASVG